MSSVDVTSSSLLFLIRGRLAAYSDLIKFRLSALVTFSAVFGYILGDRGVFGWPGFIGLILGGFFISGASSAANEIMERDLDKLMKRTQNRPLPLQLISLQEAYWFTGFIAFLGISLLWIFTNPLTTGLGILSMLLYVFAYTPLKRVGPIAVFVGAIPGAMPPLLGWTAATGAITYEALIIFGIQFVWQFPHFWAIAWVSDEDSKWRRAGFEYCNSNHDLHPFLVAIGTIAKLFWFGGVEFRNCCHGMWGSIFGSNLFANAGLFSKVSFKNHVRILYLFACSADCIFIR